jgi:hypothetical protein
MKSSTAYKISKLFYNQPEEYTEEVWDLIDAIFANDIDEIVQSIDAFLLELSRQHSHKVPGKIFHQLQDMAYQARRTGGLSQKQRRFITLALINYWDQTQLEFL